MKIRKEPVIRSIFGVTQQDMSMLLHISRSQWAMHELGQRGLPSHAMILLAELLAHAQTQKKAERFPAPNAQHLKQQYKQLDCLLRENEFQQVRLRREVAAAARKLDAQLKLLHRVDFLNSLSASKVKPSPLHLSIASIAARSLQTDHSGPLMLHELRLEVLAFEKTLLESKLRDIASLEAKGNDGK